MRILNAEPLHYSPDARRLLESLGQLHERRLSRADLLACLPDYDVLIVRLGVQVDRALLDAGARLKVIVTATTGLDHVDLAYAQQRGIAVLSLRGETRFLRSVPATAEYAWGLLLALARRIPWAHASVMRGEWQRDRFRGHTLSQRRLGLVGFGRIGEKVARYGLAFDMSVLAFDPAPVADLDGLTLCASLAGLLSQSDVLSLHVPLNAETRGLIGGPQLECLPAGALLVNTSRGAVLDETALLEVLASGRLGGAALDVLVDEAEPPGPARQALIDYASAHSNLLLTPHLGGATIESMQATEIFMAHKLQRHLQSVDGRPPALPVTDLG